MNNGLQLMVEKGLHQLPIVQNGGVVHTAIDFFARSGAHLASYLSAGLFVVGLDLIENAQGYWLVESNMNCGLEIIRTFR